MLGVQVFIRKANESYLQVTGNDGVIRELSEVLTFEVPNAKHMRRQAEKRGRKMYSNWDGRIRLLDYRNGAAYLGLHRFIKEYCNQNGYECVYEDDIDTETPFSIYEARKFFETLNLSVGTERIAVRDYQESAFIHGIQRRRAILLSPTACHPAGTKVVMYDGTLRNVEDVQVGDFLIGPDSKPREVLRLFSGEDDIYEIQPNRGLPFRVNSQHVLSLVRSNSNKVYEKHRNGEIVNLTVEDYLTKNKTFKHLHSLRHSGPIEYDYQAVLPIDPYFLGVILGDGSCQYQIGVTTADQEIKAECYTQAAAFGCDVRESKKPNNAASTYYFKSHSGAHGWRQEWHSNFILHAIEMLGLKGNDSATKHVPEEYLRSTVADRLELLAGLIDTDGYLSKGCYYEYSTKSERLRDDVILLANSVGFVASWKVKVVKGTPYYRVNIGGDIWRIPVRLERKKVAPYQRQKDHTRIGFKVQPVGRQPYYGFELSGDHLYLTDNFIISHNSGKSLIIYLLLRYLQSRLLGSRDHEVQNKILIIVPTVGLVEQMYKDFADYSYYDLDWAVEDETFRIYDGSPDLRANNGSKYTDKQIVITTWQSIYKMDLEWFLQFEVVFGDEAHLFDAKSLSNIMASLINARYRIATTGTLKGSKVNEMVLEGLFGEVYRVTTTRELMDSGTVADLTIKALVLRYNEEDCRLIKGAEYASERDFIVAHPKRRNFIRNLALSLKGNTLVLFKLKDKHGKPLHAAIQEKIGDERKLFYVAGETEAADREAVREITERETNAIIVASFGVFSTGVNIRNIHNVILTEGGKSRVLILQSIGRGLRKSDTKDSVTVFDIVDDLSVKKHKNFALQHFAERLSFYAAEMFHYIIYKISVG